MKKSTLSRSVVSLMMMVFVLSFVSCSVSSFDQNALNQANSVKGESLAVMDLATGDYTIHQAKVNELKTKLQSVSTYEKARTRNDVTVKLYDKLLDPGAHLLGGFLSRWEKDKKLNDAFVQEEKKLVSKAFDQIIELESKKK